MTGQGFKASLYYPDLGNEVVEGTLFVDRGRLRFRSESVSEEIPSERLAVTHDEYGERICFEDSKKRAQAYTCSDPRFEGGFEPNGVQSR